MSSFFGKIVVMLTCLLILLIQKTAFHQGMFSEVSIIYFKENHANLNNVLKIRLFRPEEPSCKRYEEFLENIAVKEESGNNLSLLLLFFLYLLL